MSFCKSINRACAIFSLLLLASSLLRAEEGRSPEQELATFVLEPGLKAELVAAEPLVVAPVALCFDDRGRMYVAENRGYPTQSNPPIGRIALLEDKDGDGRCETRHEFADGLTFPNGVLPWKGGLYVTCAPDVLYLKDTDGDGRADVRKIVLTGFATNGSTQLRVSHPTLGPDGWIYLAGGLVGGKVTSPGQPRTPPLDLSRHDLRFRPDTHEYEPTDGKGQFGLTFDDFGHRFFCMNRIHVQHVVLESRYLTRNSHLAFSETVENCPGDLVPEPLKGHRPAARIFPISQNITTADSHAGTFTAACGVLIYNGSALPEEFRGNVLSCDPSANLIHRDLLLERGGTFVARRAVAEKELLASRDDWFRPVFLANGPDGALYVCDMYRKTIEHPDYLPEEVRKRTDFKSGADLGRIWRVTGQNDHPRHRFGDGLKGAYALLSHPDGWVRETGFRLISEFGSQADQDALRTVLTGSPSAPGRFLALCLLANANFLTTDDLLIALEDRAPGVRERAVYFGEKIVNSNTNVLRSLLEKAQDPSAHVRFQAALSLGEAKEKARIVPALTSMARQANGDRWTHAALLSSASGIEFPLAEGISRDSTTGPGLAGLISQLGAMISQASATNLVPLVAQTPSPEFKIALLAGAGERLPSTRLAEMIPLNVRSQVVEHAIAALAPPRGSPFQVLAFKALSALQPAAGVELAVASLDALTPIEIQRAAIDLLARSGTSSLKILLDTRWRALSPAIHEYLMGKLLANDETTLLVLEQIQDGKLPSHTLSSQQRNQLKQRQSEAIRRKIDQLYSSPAATDRQSIYVELKREVLPMKANPRAGQQVFAKHCANCHRLDREGHEVGPDLFSIRNQPKEAILLHLLDPDYEIVPGFAAYEIETTDGESFSGLLKSETPSSLTLRMAGGLEENILRSRIARVQSSTVSLMPQELENAMSRQELANLLAYLKGE